MATRYVSYDIREGNDYTSLYAFIEAHGGQEITQSLYLFESTLPLEKFTSQLRDAFAGDDSVYVLFATKTSITHRKV